MSAVVYHPASDQYRPYDPCRATGDDPDLVSLCWDCADGYRPLPDHQFMTTHVARFGRGWRLRRGEVLTWLHRTAPELLTRTT